MKNKVFFCSSVNGCPSNSYLGSVVVESLRLAGYEIVLRSKDADYVIVNTCGAVKSTEKKSLELIDFFKNRYGNKKKIIVTGCLTKISNQLKNREDLILAYGLLELKEIFPEISESTCVNKMNKGLSITSEFDVSDYFVINISEGCLGNCSYCSVKFARGNLKSKPFDDVVNEFSDGYAQGYRKFYLIGDDCACYGRDIGRELADLLDVFLKKGDVRVACNYLEPVWLIKGYSRLKKHFHEDKISYASIPIQSANNRILRLMNRGYQFEDIKKIIEDIKLNSSSILSTYFIFGFPTETYEEFLDTVKGARSELFDIITFRLYSERKNTKSVDIYPKVSINEIQSRFKYLKEFAKNRKLVNFCLSGEIDECDSVI